MPIPHTHLKHTLASIFSNACGIQVFGLGYVGLPLALRLADAGFHVIGVDTDPAKVESLRQFVLPTSQRNLRSAFMRCMHSGTFVPSQRAFKSDHCRIGIICVPTPIANGNGASEAFVYRAARSFLDTARPGDVVLIESSVRVGTSDNVGALIESHGYTVGEDFGLCVCPERIDPLNRKWKLANIPRVIFASDDTTFRIAQEVYKPVNNSNLYRVSTPAIAEVVKSFENTFRLVNISLANELAMLCDTLAINVDEVLEAASTKPFGFMRFSTGAGAGGHCIPKDPTFLLQSAEQHGLGFASISTAIHTNARVPRYIAEAIGRTVTELELARSVLICGLSYKADIEDMRDSPGFKIAAELQRLGFAVGAHDPHFRHELMDKYLIENHMSSLDWNIVIDLDEEAVRNYDCVCIVQHHATTAPALSDLYAGSSVPFIYDCQNRLEYDPGSSTMLRGFGGRTDRRQPTRRGAAVQTSPLSSAWS